MENCLDTLEQNENQIILLKLNIKTVDQELHFQLECVRNMEAGLGKDIFDSKLMSSIRRIELLYEGKSNLDLYSENGTTYLMMILKLHGYSSITEKLNETPRICMTMHDFIFSGERNPDGAGTLSSGCAGFYIYHVPN
ncbi:MAG: hypothetical protein WDM78_10560 [Puia sp.]